MNDILSINYVDAPPGTGKTRACIEMMRRHVQAGIKNENQGYIFYVAPTKKLLDQTVSNLLKVLPKKDHSFVRTVYCEGKHGPDRTENWIYNIMNGRRVSELGVVLFEPGSILFMTHATFIKLRRHDKFKDTTVIFDESRKWIHRYKIKMNEPGVKELFDSLFTLVPLERYSGINVLKPRFVSENTKSRLATKKASIKEFETLDNIHRHLLPSDGPVRMKVYAIMRGTTMIQIMLPSRPFIGFKMVYVLSASFRNSQMYHLFKSEKILQHNCTRDFMDRYLEGGYAKALDTILKRQDYLTVIPLSLGRDIPSKYQYNSGLMVPEDKQVMLKHKMEELGFKTKVLRDVISHLRNPALYAGVLKSKQKQLLAFIQEIGCQLDVLQWQVKSSARIARWWFSKHGMPGRGLLFVNSDREPKYDTEIFSKLSIGKAEGNNNYLKRNVVAFLAAVNPEKEIAHLLETVLNGYNPDLDYVIDKAIQCIGRGNIRNHKSKKYMAAIVPSLELAESIVNCMEGAPALELRWARKLGDYVIWSWQRATSAEIKQLGYRAVLEKQNARSRKFRSNPLNKELANLRSYRSIYKRRGNLEKVMELESKIQALIDQRDKNR